MTQIRVNPESVRGYGRQAGAIFAQIHTELTKLVDDVVGVHYFGPNAVDFKTKAGQLAADFAAKLHQDIAAMADAVRTSTSNIAASLGGTPISITVDNKAITPPTPAKVDYVDVDTEALTGLGPVVGNHFTALANHLATHQRALGATDWTGAAKNTAVEAVARLTTTASGHCQAAHQAISTYITDQVNASVAADR